MSRRKHHVKRNSISIRSNQKASARAQGNALAANLFNVNVKKRKH
ncbi:hypothetical protein ACFQ5D_23275 [Paenibacillus farraposensis]|uniref:Uncharacterized protein n=1 Tax=Paenibacillus farraposensis TaxID=2807095 RepID=A0ABW4DK88_9BACL